MKLHRRNNIVSTGERKKEKTRFALIFQAERHENRFHYDLSLSSQYLIPRGCGKRDERRKQVARAATKRG